MFKKNVVKSRTFHLESSGKACEAAVLELQLQGFRSIANLELRSEFDREPRRLDLAQHAHLFKQSPVIRQQRLPNVKPREVLPLQDQGSFAGPRYETGRSRTAGATADDQDVKACLGHWIRKHKRAGIQPPTVVEPGFSRAGSLRVRQSKRQDCCGSANFRWTA